MLRIIYKKKYLKIIIFKYIINFSLFIAYYIFLEVFTAYTKYILVILYSVLWDKINI